MKLHVAMSVLFALAAFGGKLAWADQQSLSTKQKTNVVFILTDNQGAWTLGCYGNPDIRTPHIDRLASDDVVFYEMEDCRAVRGQRWKLVRRHPDGPHELYDMQSDPQERFNLYGQPGFEPQRAEMQARLDDFFSRYADPQYDLWNGGRSKAKRLGVR